MRAQLDTGADEYGARTNACAENNGEVGHGLEVTFRARRGSVRVCSGYVATKNAGGSNACAVSARRYK